MTKKYYTVLRYIKKELNGIFDQKYFILFVRIVIVLSNNLFFDQKQKDSKFTLTRKIMYHFRLQKDVQIHFWPGKYYTVCKIRHFSPEKFIFLTRNKRGSKVIFDQKDFVTFMLQKGVKINFWPETYYTFCKKCQFSL